MPTNKVIKQNIVLAAEEWEKLEILSGLDYSLDHIALYFNLDKTVVRQLAADPDSKLSTHLQAGKVKQRADEHMGVYQMAVQGDVPAFKALDEIRRTRLFKITKLDIFGGFDSKVTVQTLQDYLRSEGRTDITPEEHIYMDALRLIRGMDIQYGKRATIAFLNNKLGLIFDNAKKFYVEAFNLFNHDEGLDKAALRNKYADNMDQAAQHVKENALTSADWRVYRELNVTAYEMCQLHKEEAEPIDPNMYLRPYTMYTLDVQDIKMSPINRNEVARQIDAQKMPERDKERLREDARLKPLDIRNRLESTKEEFSKSK